MSSEDVIIRRKNKPIALYSLVLYVHENTYGNDIGIYWTEGQRWRERNGSVRRLALLSTSYVTILVSQIHINVFRAP